MPRSVWCGRQEWFQLSRQVRDALDNLPVRNGGATRRERNRRVVVSQCYRQLRARQCLCCRVRICSPVP